MSTYMETDTGTDTDMERDTDIDMDTYIDIAHTDIVTDMDAELGHGHGQRHGQVKQTLYST